MDSSNETRNPPSPKKPSLAVALLPLIAMGLLLGIGYGVYKIRPQVLLVFAAFLTGCLGVILKFSWKEHFHFTGGIISGGRSLERRPRLLVFTSQEYKIKSK